MARDFNGSSDVLRYTSGPVSTATDDITFGLWCYLDSVGSQMVLMSNGQDNGYALQVRSGGWSTLLPGVANLDTGTLTDTGVWQHALIRRASTTWTFFLNGSASGSTFTTTPGTPSGEFDIGAQWVGALQRYTDGRLAEAAFWGAALTDAEIASLGEGFCPLLVRPSSLTAYWPIIGRESPEPDRRGGFPLALTGTANIEHPLIILPTSYQSIHAPAAAPGGGGGTSGNLLLLGVG